MKTYTKTVISESEYKHIQHLHTNIYRVMVRESEQDGMLTVATAKYDHEPTEDEIMADYNASVEAVNRMALQQAQRQKIREIDAYNDSDSVNGFYINGAKVWVDAETRVKGDRQPSMPKFARYGIDNKDNIVNINNKKLRKYENVHQNSNQRE